MNYKIENGVSGPILIFNDGLKQETYFNIPNNILNIIKELEQDNRQLELILQQKEDIINKAIKFVKDYKTEWTLNDEVLNDMDKLLEILDNKGE